MQWLRWYHGTVADPKFRLIASKSGARVCEVVAIWAAVLENASESTERGTLEGWNDEVVAIALDLELEQVSRILDVMRSCGMLDEAGNVTAWGKRQPRREDSSAERMRRHRQQKSQAHHVTQSDAAVPNGDAPVTPCDARGEEIRAENISPPNPPGGGDRFADFWEAYPRKVGKKPAEDKWKRKRLDAMADRIIADVRERAAKDRRWREGYILNPAAYLTQERWNDAIEEERISTEQTRTYRLLEVKP